MRKGWWRRSLVAGAFCAYLASGISAKPAIGQDTDAVFTVEETTIPEVHAAMLAGLLSARELVEQYLERIEAFDRRGPSLNALVRLNPRALQRADELDAALKEGGLVGPLHGIPLIIKDNYDTVDMPTSAGSLALAESQPLDDATQIRRMRLAGGIVLAKSNMAEFAFSPYETVSSVLPGYSRNPYDPRRVTAGSSGGTAAAVAANLGLIGLGTDTGNSIRGPSSHQALVGIRSTMGLTSRDGIIPLYLDHDIGGPMARTVADAARVLTVIAGFDPKDPVTAASRENEPLDYTTFLNADGLDGARLGVVRQLTRPGKIDGEVLQRFNEALDDLRGAGAVIVDPVTIPELDTIPVGERWCPRFRYDFEHYLRSLGKSAPVKSLSEVLESGGFHPTVRGALEYFNEISLPPEDLELCHKAWENGRRLATGVRRVLQASRLDAILFPTWSYPPRLIGDLNTPHGDNSQDLSPHTGFPAITVPMGFVRETETGELPVGLQWVGDAWSEGRLIELAYAYEQKTQHRRPPASTPSLR